MLSYKEFHEIYTDSFLQIMKEQSPTTPCHMAQPGGLIAITLEGDNEAFVDPKVKYEAYQKVIESDDPEAAAFRDPVKIAEMSVEKILQDLSRVSEQNTLLNTATADNLSIKLMPADTDEPNSEFVTRKYSSSLVQVLCRENENIRIPLPVSVAKEKGIDYQSEQVWKDALAELAFDLLMLEESNLQLTSLGNFALVIEDNAGSSVMVPDHLQFVTSVYGLLNGKAGAPLFSPLAQNCLVCIPPTDNLELAWNSVRMLVNMQIDAPLGTKFPMNFFRLEGNKVVEHTENSWAPKPAKKKSVKNRSVAGKKSPWWKFW